MLSCWSLTATEGKDMLPLKKHTCYHTPTWLVGRGEQGMGKGRIKKRLKDNDKMDKKREKTEKGRLYKKKYISIYIHIGNTFFPPNSCFHEKGIYSNIFPRRLFRPQWNQVLSSKCFISSSLSHDLTTCAVINEHRRVFLFSS